jgi:glycosyltransferase involved in cell wall biosynthesis
VVSGIRVAERRGRWRLQLDRWTDRLVERHVCVSQSVADFSHTIGGLSAAKLLVIPNGVDIARYATAHPVEPSELGLPAGRRWITYIGRLDRQKGLAWLIEQTPTWFAAHPQHDLLLVGDGAERAELTQLISRVAPPGRVHLVGWQSNVPGILRASDLMVLPSRWEGMPNVVLEAMAAGRSVLAADVEGVRELLGSAAGPQIAHLEDTNDWGAKLTHLLADPQLAAELGAGNQARARDHFSLEASVLAYASLYTKLVGASNAPASTSDLA